MKLYICLLLACACVFLPVESQGSSNRDDHCKDCKVDCDKMCSGKPTGQTAQEQSSWPWWKIAGATGLAIAAGAAAPVAVPAAVGAIGFGTGGIAAGSFAATMMSTLGTSAGGLVATCQSIGAVGALSATGNIVAAGAGATVGAATGKMLGSAI